MNSFAHQSSSNRRPRAALSAYNLFMLLERERILAGTDHLNLPVRPEDLARLSHHHKTRPRRPHRKSHGKIDFATLSRIVATRWKQLSPDLKQVFEDFAHMEKMAFSNKNRRRSSMKAFKNHGNHGNHGNQFIENSLSSFHYGNPQTTPLTRSSTSTKTPQYGLAGCSTATMKNDYQHMDFFPPSHSQYAIESFFEVTEPIEVKSFSWEHSETQKENLLSQIHEQRGHRRPSYKNRLEKTFSLTKLLGSGEDPTASRSSGSSMFLCGAFQPIEIESSSYDSRHGTPSEKALPKLAVERNPKDSDPFDILEEFALLGGDFLAKDDHVLPCLDMRARLSSRASQVCLLDATDATHQHIPFQRRSSLVWSASLLLHGGSGKPDRLSEIRVDPVELQKAMESLNPHEMDHLFEEDDDL